LDICDELDEVRTIRHVTIMEMETSAILMDILEEVIDA
jgi:hypothetical protein